jgi:hypothetical protein
MENAIPGMLDYELIVKEAGECSAESLMGSSPKSCRMFGETRIYE